MDESISRNEAVNALMELIEARRKWMRGEKEIAGLDAGICALIDLPSVEPERKTGKWIDYSDEGYVECPFCHSATNCEGNKDELHYCFSCGAELRGEQE